MSTITTTAYLDSKEVARRWGRSPRTLANERSAGKGCAYVKLPGGAIRYRLEEVLKYEADNFRTIGATA